MPQLSGQGKSGAKMTPRSKALCHAASVCDPCPCYRCGQCPCDCSGERWHPCGGRTAFEVGAVLYLYWDDHDPPRVGALIDLDTGQTAEVLTAKCSDGAHEARKLTARVLAEPDGYAEDPLGGAW